MEPLSDRLVSLIEEYTEKLLQLSEDEVAYKPNSKKWSKKEYLGHLMDSATNNHQRFVRGQLYDQSVFPGYDQPLWVEVHKYQSIEWTELVLNWKTFNMFLSKVIANMNQNSLSNTLTVGESKSLTLQSVIEGYIDHMENHLKDVFG